MPGQAEVPEITFICNHLSVARCINASCALLSWCMNTALVNNFPGLHSCIMFTLWYIYTSVGLIWCRNTALVSTTTKGIKVLCGRLRQDEPWPTSVSLHPGSVQADLNILHMYPHVKCGRADIDWDLRGADGEQEEEALHGEYMVLLKAAEEN